MKRLLVAALLCAQMGPCIASAQAAELVAEPLARTTQMGAFAGARVRLSLGGEREKVRAGVMVAPSMHSAADGAVKLRIGEGLEYGWTQRQASRVTFAGRPLAQIADAGRTPAGDRHGVTPTGWVAIGAGVLLLAGAITVGWLVAEANSNTE